MRQIAALLRCGQGGRVTIGDKVYGGPGPYAEKILAFAPGDRQAPSLQTVAPDGTLPILGGVRMPAGVARGVVCDGKVVSWAVARLPDEAGVRHITVETDPRYRRRGFAKACLQALLQDVDAPLLYLCDSRNKHSARAALSAGFVLIGTMETNPIGRV